MSGTTFQESSWRTEFCEKPADTTTFVEDSAKWFVIGITMLRYTQEKQPESMLTNATAFHLYIYADSKRE